MPATGAIATQNPVVYIGGSELPEAELQLLAEIRVELELRLPGRVTLRFQDPDGALATGTRFGLGKEVQIKAFGVGTIIDAEITGLAYEASTGAVPRPRRAGRTSAVDEFIVTAHDRAHRLTRRSTVAGLTQMKSSDLVSRVAVAVGLTANVTTTTTTYPAVTQAYNDFELLNALADREGYDWWVGPRNTLHFEQPSTSSSLSLALGTEQLESFTVTATGLRPDKVSVRGWDRDQQQTIIGSAALSGHVLWPSEVELLTDFPHAGGKFGGDMELVTGQLAPTTDDSTSLATALAGRIAAGSVVARGVGEGNADITVGKSVRITGSKPVNGVYHVTKVEHVVRPDSFKTRFVAGDRTPTSLADVVGGSDRAQFPLRHLGVVTAVVTGVGAADAEGKDMIHVAFTGLDGQLESAWARFLAVGGGGDNGRGLVMLPETNDEVLVAFENGDLHHPVVLGGLYSQKNPVSTWDVTGGKVMSRRFISRVGHLIEIKDGDEEGTRYVKIEVVRKDGKNVLFNLAGDKVELTVPAQEPVTVQAGDSKIAIAASGNIDVEAPTITLKGTQKISLQAPTIDVKADQALSLDGGTKTDVKGIAVAAEATAAMTIKGMPVKVN